MYSLQNTLKQKVKEGELWERLDEKRIRCYACGHCCPIPEGHAPGARRHPLEAWGRCTGHAASPISTRSFRMAGPSNSNNSTTSPKTPVPGLRFNPLSLLSQVRFNRGGKLLVPWGYVGGVQCDPIEKKPFFHAYPGALAYSFGMLGCDLHCGYCQNWVTSQALRDPAAVAPPRRASHVGCAHSPARPRTGGEA